MNIVTIGGGKGQSTLLRALRDSGHRLTAIVSVMDDGGSSGKMRELHGIVPPGDLRRNLAALAPDDSVYDRWNERDANGDPIGNLEILKSIQEHNGDIGAGLVSLESKLNLTHRVLPVSINPSGLIAEYNDGTTLVHGETHIDVPRHDSNLHIRRLTIQPPVDLYEPARLAIKQADVVVLTMGDLYTSIIPNLLVNDMAQALSEAGMPVVYICNRATKQGETHGFSSGDFANEIQRYLSPAILTHVIADDNSVPASQDVEIVKYEPAAGPSWTAVALATSDKPGRVDGLLAAQALLRLCATF